ncbi:MAG: glycosyltransferase family 4 protein [Candidatus Omnitrophica bacterium]|nr:glycosyltransferase family 4 protein [Candidatus Omnitrophota bacterium]
MNICILGKYPPIQGGVSTCNYWLSKALGQRGHKVFVVTNAEEAGFEYREQIYPSDARQLEPKNVRVFSTQPLSRRFIPQYQPFIAKLASMAIEIVKKNKIDVLYSNYLLPYGVAGLLVKQATGVPWFLDHAGSDITNLFDEPELRPIFLELFKNADLVVNSPQVKSRLVDSGVIPEDKLSPSIGKMSYTRALDDSFHPQAKPFDLSDYFDRFNRRLPVFTFLGKISPLKKTFAFVEAAAKLPKGKFYLLFVTEKGRMRIHLRNLIREKGLLPYTCLLDFKPPWLVPSIITASTAVVAPESEETPYLPEGTHGSKIGLEAMLCGRCAVIGKGMSKKAFYYGCKDKEHFLVVDPHNINTFAKKLKLIVDDPGLAYKIGKKARAVWTARRNFFEASLDLFVKNFKIAILKNSCLR